jgi:hypothetical protein
MLFSFQNVENEMTYASLNISENKGSDLFTVGLYALLGDILIYFIADGKNMPAWA